ncbi:hypothetical protein [Variovorax sp. YR216]|uniref:hypothetical protein n=1 Tax=Variovorax sp. YR216 TaxID=1882828 RepID=UPI000894A1DD|nr:hypothetical protein [Variovorax sp. YR216]SEA76013.1 hypothetical protein SAMN05444680_103461 [Variovorax sp. YR216]
MPRWLVASFIVFVLSCYGFAAAAQGRTSGIDLADACKAAVASIQQDTPPAGDASSQDASDEFADLDEAGSDFTEFLTGVRPLLVPVVAAAWPPRLAPLTVPPPLLERPKRPPRASLFLV